ncbi:hypothetical protein G210_3999 [Candida maltosa Xu316]|uniref:Ndc10 domain-containing protein n=1 Tax=Candida maltosa (strain Xu316) TaxID=1245528 RepID=M3HEW6_CANMX|nr:hypothetical protein G210_3999 [Candida maltosa Xu316]
MSDSEDSLIDTNDYTIDDYYKLVKPLLAAKNINANYLNDHKLLRTLVDFNLSHSLFLKNLSKRQLELNDLIPSKINYIDTIIVKSTTTTSSTANTPPTIHSTTTTTNNDSNPSSPSGSISSIDKDSSFHYTGCFRNKFVEFCPHFAIAAYLFSRFHIPDEYGSYEFILSDSSKKITLDHVKLMKGNNKLSTISYSQQHKSSINALSISGLNYKDINLTKLLSTHEDSSNLLNHHHNNNNNNNILSSKKIDDLNHSLMLKLSGFNSFEDYNLLRNSFQPPQSLLDKIFPFINDINPQDYSEEMLQIKELLIMLRKSLVQDMVIIKKKYPLNPLSKSEIFSSMDFLNFINSIELSNDLNDIINQSVFNSNDTGNTTANNDTDETDPDSNETNSWPLSSTHDEDLNKIIDTQNKKIKQLDEYIHDLVNTQQTKMLEILNNFVETQNQVFLNQSENMQKILNSINGLIILISSQNKNSLQLANQSLQETSNFIKNVEHTNIEKGINNTMELLSNLNQLHQKDPPPPPSSSSASVQNPPPPPSQPLQPRPMSQPSTISSLIHHQPPPPPPLPISSTATSSTSSTLQHTIPLQPPLPHQQHPYYLPHTSSTNTPSQQLSHPMSPIPLTHQAPPPPPQPLPHVHQIPPLQPINMTPQQIERQRALNRRLSRQATTLFEMWDDFKGLEKELRDHDITVTEWLKVHGSSERQFRHTRLKIIKFIEEEAIRRRSNVEYIKERLHNKMRNRVRPWTLDEVQRMLTANKRIDLDDNS